MEKIKKYTPDKKFIGIDEFTLEATDSKGDTSEIATVSITVGNKKIIDNKKPSSTTDDLDLDGFIPSTINIILEG